MINFNPLLGHSQDGGLRETYRTADKVGAEGSLTGGEFLSSFKEISKAVKIKVTDEAATAALQTAKEKTLKEKPFDFDKAEVDYVDSCLNKIAKMLKLDEK